MSPSPVLDFPADCHSPHSVRLVSEVDMTASKAGSVAEVGRPADGIHFELEIVTAVCREVPTLLVKF